MKEADKIMNLIVQWVAEKKTGSIKLNFFKGGVSSINKEETIKLSSKT